MVESMAVGLRERGYLCSVLTYGDTSGRMSGGTRAFPLQVTRIGKDRPSPLRQAQYFLALLKMARKADLIYVTDTYSVGLSALAAKKLLGTPYVVRFAGDSAWELASAAGTVTDDLETFQRTRYSRAVEMRKALRRSIMRNADHVIAVSRFMRAIAGLIGVEDKKCTIIYNSVDFLREEGGASGKPNAIGELRARLPEDAILAGTACRLTVWKGVDLAIRALARAALGGFNIHLAVMGDGPERENLERLAHSLGMERRVHFLGRIDQSEMGAHLRSLDVFVLSSLYEGLSHTILQAMQAGTPVIASDIGGNPELVEDGVTGLLVPPRDDGEIAAALCRLLTSPGLRRRLVDGARARLSDFSWTTTMESTCRILRDIIG